MIDKLHYISQQPTNETHITAIKAALLAGCKWIQLRVKDQPENVIIEYALEARALCEEFDAKLIVNDHPEIALKAGAYGLHLGLQDIPIAQARQIVGNQMIIGGTANTFEHIEQRVAEGADYIGLGPYRFTKTKQKLSPILGLEGYREILERVRSGGINIPIIAIGGIEPNDIPAIMQTGVHGVAISGAITHAADAAQTTQHIYRQLHMNVLKEV
ncbi:thiamine-phosphate diphosphorylase [Mucilaginibacter sp. OK268]|uniref:thiamine phosphate synthase n=1 Tax=Mucilaginibacter sp. OK268 TaxID=1881048 RepID=UPI00088D2260|nr:thiamine phosphate synthase [Mucilaginibacter sp. OK268]SDP91447.1 thiamine-phosphate diphosphorylase [Mucilaginibacter sp. OK268]